MIRSIVIFSFLFLLMSCNGNNSGQTENTSANSADKTENASNETGKQQIQPRGEVIKDKEMNSLEEKIAANDGVKPEGVASKEMSKPDLNKGIIPDISQIITLDEISDLVKVPADQIEVKDSRSRQPGTNTKSCFFRWQTDDNPNAGIFLQIAENPVKDEYADWASQMIKTKIMQGDHSTSEQVSYKYEALPDIGMKGCVNHEIRKVYWQISDMHVVQFSDNYDITDKQRIKMAREIESIFKSRLNL